MSDEDLVSASLAVGLPVLLKPAAGGGGKGMRRVASAEELGGAIAAARREAEGAFGDGTLLVERWVSRPRHIEVQVFADSHGHAVHLGERECSLQRRHQKIVEESPSPLLDAATRRAMTASAVDVARAVGYVGAGTVEFIVSGERPEEYFFMEMNTRLQVEHPVTEAVTGIDLVDWQLRVAAGEPLPLTQDDVHFEGHAVEARVYAEDPARGFLPTGGTVAVVREPSGRPGIRVDSSLVPGTVVGSRYDPMLAKVVAHGGSRAEALARLRGALEATSILGLTTNVGYLTRLLADPDVVAGRLDTELVERTLPELAAHDPGEEADAAVAAACSVALGLEPPGPVVDPWEVPDGWRAGGAGAWAVRLRADGRRDGLPASVPVSVVVRGRLGAAPPGSPAPATVTVDGGPPVAVRVRPATDEPGALDITIGAIAGTIGAAGGTTARWRSAVAGDELWVGRAGRAWRFLPDLDARGEGRESSTRGGPLTSPMPGVVVSVNVAPGDEVHAGQVLVVVEAMKMEHAVAAPGEGVVAALFVRAGQTVGLDEPLAELA